MASTTENHGTSIIYSNLLFQISCNRYFPLTYPTWTRLPREETQHRIMYHIWRWLLSCFSRFIHFFQQKVSNCIYPFFSDNSSWTIIWTRRQFCIQIISKLIFIIATLNRPLHHESTAVAAATPSGSITQITCNHSVPSSSRRLLQNTGLHDWVRRNVLNKYGH